MRLIVPFTKEDVLDQFWHPSYKSQRAPSLYGATEGSAREAADVRLESFVLSRGLSAAAESAFPEGAIASILRDAFGREHRSEAPVG